MEENEFTTIRLSNATKERFEALRATIPYEDAATADEFIKYLINFYKEYNTKKK